MAAFPDYADILLSGYAERSGEVVQRKAFDRGLAGARRTSTRAVVQLAMTVQLQSKAHADAFALWLYAKDGGNGGASFFGFTDPRTGAAVQARLVADKIGELKPLAGNFRYAEVALELEFLR